jgi:Holliday junction resolvasome RuvABC endonuclease subunit
MMPKVSVVADTKGRLRVSKAQRRDILAALDRNNARFVGQIGRLNAVEKQLREQHARPQFRAAVRAWQSRPIPERLRRALEVGRRRVLPKSLLGQRGTGFRGRVSASEKGTERTLDLLFTRFCQFVKIRIDQAVTRLVFEDVTFFNSTMQIQIGASLRAAILTAAQESSVEVFCVHTGTLKAFATGNGRSDKMAMGQALAKADPANCALKGATLLFREDPADDDEVDAIWLARYAMAMDRGEQRFLSAYQRGSLRQEEKRKKRLELKAAQRKDNRPEWMKQRLGVSDLRIPSRLQDGVVASGAS